MLPDWSGDELMGGISGNVLDIMTKVQAKLLILTCLTSVNMNLNIMMEGQSN